MTENKQQERCHGEGEIKFNPGYPDPQTETSAPCPGCPDCQPAPPDPLAALREAERLTIYVCPCGAIIRGAPFGGHSGCGSPQRVEVIPLQATEPLIAENEELRTENERIKMAVRECDSKAEKLDHPSEDRIVQYRLNTGPWHRLLALTGTGPVEKSEAEMWRERALAAESARSTSEALAGALEKASAYTLFPNDDPGQAHNAITVERSYWQGASGPFPHPNGEWAIRRRHFCLNRDGEWEWELQPSNRKEEFFARCRFELNDALSRARSALDSARTPTKENPNG